ncbi:hypothetical protein BT67DRAFT_392107 [Trichocladium antarcticum]|uniref:Thiamine-triphosphatase n=1 Tax=Trichocladium antarcticum TaxID=1450529 RepID=A0AAN6UBQ9_9PEZI|nr:hypothetical protein BT67DRAFT_392107 [Trichocladium antarcticum]
MALRPTRALLTQTPSATLLTTILEVERKFPRLAVPTLTSLHQHNPPFASVVALPTRTIHDIYFDTAQHTLAARGTYVRRRDGAWQAKVRRGGDHVDSRFEELRGREAVEGCVARVLQEQRDGGPLAGLGRMAEFVTTREGWVVDGVFAVVRDRMDFGHEVGEVELQVEVARGMGGAEKARVMEEMDGRIGVFMERYAWAWEAGTAVGKLTAYLAMVARARGRGRG